MHNPFEVVAASNNMTKYLPGLQTVPSRSSSSSSDISKHAGTAQSHTELDDAFAAFAISGNEDIYDRMGPEQQKNKALKVRQHKEPKPADQQRPDFRGIPQKQPQMKQDWIDNTQNAFENVAGSVSGSATSPSLVGAGILDNASRKHPLSPTSTLSSNTANRQQNRSIQILFPKKNQNREESFGDSSGTQQPNVYSLPKLDNPFPTHHHVELEVRPAGSQVIVSSNIGKRSVTAFYDALQSPKTPVDSIQKTLHIAPGLAKVRLQTSASYGRLPLHTACARGFPTHNEMLRQLSSSTDLAVQLVEDIQKLYRLITILVEANRGACTVLDDRGDLPAHLLARTLMEWEAQWYEKVYEKVQNNQDADGRNAAAITRLYQSMSQCVEAVLNPIAAFCNAKKSETGTMLCRAPGSVGSLLPLHIASIFTASVPTLRRLLEQDPSTAADPCSLGHLRTFIPDQSLPFELHDKLSTDFPKWEIGKAARKSKKMQVNGCLSGFDVEDYMRRSDLLFAFYPVIPDYQVDQARIERLISKVISEAIQIGDSLDRRGKRGRFSMAVKYIWVWMCTLQDIHGSHFCAAYYKSVNKILDSVPLSTVPYLTSIRTPQGRPLMIVAAPECQALMRERMRDYEIAHASKLEQMVSMAVAGGVASTKAAGARDTYSSSVSTNVTVPASLKGRGYVGILCRKLFHIHENSIPTSFILLPYKLTKNEHGKLGIDKRSSAKVAVAFAECLLKLTDPKAILYFLEQKRDSLNDNENREASSDASIVGQRKYCELEKTLLSLYSSGNGYLYFIDELVGLPVVPEIESEGYPINLANSNRLVQKLLPLMLTGMVLMRGEKALSVIVNVLLDKSARPTQNWVEVSQEIISYLQSQQESRSNSSLPGLGALINELQGFVKINSGAPAVSNHPSAQWDVELLILQMVLSYNKNCHQYGGLHAKRDQPGMVLWTKHKIEDEICNERSASSSNKLTSSISSNFDNSSRASTKKSGNHSSEDGLAAGGALPMSPDSGCDIENLQMKSSFSESADKLTANENASPTKAGSEFEGEEQELAGVNILLDAEEGPSLLDQEATSDKEGVDLGHNCIEKSIQHQHQLQLRAVKQSELPNNDPAVGDKHILVDTNDDLSQAGETQESKSSAKSQRSVDRNYNEIQVEEINHVKDYDSVSAFPTVNLFENKALLLQSKLATDPAVTLSCFTSDDISIPVPLATATNDSFLDNENLNIVKHEQTLPLLCSSATIKKNVPIKSGKSNENISQINPRQMDNTAVCGNENSVSGQELTFMELRENLNNQALKIDCFEQALQSISIREDKLLSRGEMLQNFLTDLVNQSATMNMVDNEKQTQKIQCRLGGLEERVVCSEIELQHLKLRLYALEEELQVEEESSYNRELSNIVKSNISQLAEEFATFNNASDLSAMKTQQMHHHTSSRFDIADSSMIALDCFSSSDVQDSISEHALDGYSSHQIMESSPYEHVARNTKPSEVEIDEYSVEYELGLAMWGTLAIPLENFQYQADSADLQLLSCNGDNSLSEAGDNSLSEAGYNVDGIASLESFDFARQFPEKSAMYQQ